MESKIDPQVQPNSWKKAEEESSTAQKALCITVIAESIENLDICKLKEIIVKMEFAGDILIMSENIKVVNQAMDINLKGFIKAEDIDLSFINTLLNNPVLFTVYDCSQSIKQSPSTHMMEKDANKKTAKTTTSRASVTMPGTTHNVLGICNLDLVNLMEKNRIRETLILEFDKNVLVKDSVTTNKLPRLSVLALIQSEECLSKQITEFDNILGITVESIYNIPENITEGSAFDATITVPTSGNENNNLLFSSGLATLLKESNSRRKWCSLHPYLQGPGGRSQKQISDSSYDIISSLPIDLDLQKTLDKPEIRIQWNTWQRCLFTRSESNYFCSKLMKYHVWPIEIVSASKSNISKATKLEKKSKPVFEASSNSEHFTAFLKISSLLYPGGKYRIFNSCSPGIKVTKVRVAAPLLTYSRSDLMNKFGVELPLFNSQASVATVSKSKAMSEKSRTSAKEPEGKKEESSGVPVTNKDGLPTFIIVEIELHKSFTRAKSPDFLEKDIKSYLSIKGKCPQKVMNLTVAQDCYSKAIQGLIYVIGDEYMNFIQSDKNKKNENHNSSAAFHNYLICRESFSQAVKCLESRVMSFVLEKYGKLYQYDEKIPEIYATLVKEMHMVTNSSNLGNNINYEVKDFHAENRQLFVDEAMEENDFMKAKSYLQENIAKHKNNPDYWLNYAVYLIRMQDYDQALEAIRETLALDIHHQIGLLLYGSLMVILKNRIMAETTFQYLTSKYPFFIEGWKTFHFLHVIFQNFEGVDATLQMTAKLEHEKQNFETISEKSSEIGPEQSKCRHEYLTESQDFLKEDEYGIDTLTDNLVTIHTLAWTTSFCHPEKTNIRTTVLLLKLGLFEFASMALSEELLIKKNTVCPSYQYYLAVNYYLQGRFNEAIRQLEIAVKEFGKDCYLWSLMGHCFYKIQDHANAFACYQYVMESHNRPDDIHLIYLRMGFYYLEKNKLLCAKQVFTTGCKYSPSPRMWKGAGIVLLLLNEYEEAETAFGEANYLDNKDPETWGYLALVNGYFQKLDMLKYCYLEAKKRKLKNQGLIEDIERCLLLNNLEPGDLNN